MIFPCRFSFFYLTQSLCCLLLGAFDYSFLFHIFSRHCCEPELCEKISKADFEARCLSITAAFPNLHIRHALGDGAERRSEEPHIHDKRHDHPDIHAAVSCVQDFLRTNPEKVPDFPHPVGGRFFLSVRTLSDNPVKGNSSQYCRSSAVE